jgi:hypothetical protein
MSGNTPPNVLNDVSAKFFMILFLECCVAKGAA